jgi:hypothetical protein
MLWFDDSTDRPLVVKIQRAAEYYRTKYGQAPNTCYVPVSAAVVAPGPIAVVPARDVLAHHLWIGIA